MFARKHNKKKSEINNRLRLIMAVILLLGGALIYRLYDLQILKYDLYIALASDQHQVFNKLKPERGKIFIQDDKELLNANIYPIATNKNFALVYAIPSKVEKADDSANKLYDIFDRENIEKEVEELLDNDEALKINDGDVVAIKPNLCRTPFIGSCLRKRSAVIVGIEIQSSTSQALWNSMNLMLNMKGTDCIKN